jgi:hypothetical protein
MTFSAAFVSAVYHPTYRLFSPTSPREAISEPHGGTLSTTSRRSVRLQSERNSPRHLNAGTPQGLRTVQGEPETRHSPGTHRPIQASCTRHRRLHVRHGRRVAATPPGCSAAFFNNKLNTTEKITATPLPPTSTQQSTQPRPQHHRPRHHRPSHELHAPNVTHASLLASTAEQPFPGGGGR